MNYISKIMILFLLFFNNNNVFAIETVDKIKKKSKNIFKTLTRKSLNKEEMLIFLSKYVVIIDDNRGDGFVTYYFDDVLYKRYKDLELISKDVWNISRSGKLKIYINSKKEIWKIQPDKRNTINIKKKINTVGKLYDFSYEDKTNFYLNLEEKKINSNQ